jgi:predicted dehydrogenase
VIGIGVIGYGYWGPNLVRNFSESARGRVVAVSDLSPKRLALAAARYPALHATADARELIQNPAVDAVVVATPVSTHFDLAMAALSAGKHVLVEKPMAASSEQCIRLIAEADKRGRVLMVDHTFVYTSAVRKIRELIAAGELGRLHYYDSVRVNLGIFQHDVNVIWDLAVHDLSILRYLFADEPWGVSATGMSHVEEKAENIAYMTLFYPNNFLAHIHVNWLAPVKVRRTMICGSRRMIIYDDTESSEKLKVYDKGVDVTNDGEASYRLRVNYRAGDMWAPNLDTTEALTLEVTEFLDCMETGRKPVTDGAAGLSTVRALEGATESMANHGKLIELKPLKELARAAVR